MTHMEMLLVLRNNFAAGTITEDEFRDGVNAVYQNLQQATDAEKIAAFDRIALSILSNLQIDEISGNPEENEICYYSNDAFHYIMEEALKAVVGDDYFKFFNTVYRSG